MRAAPTVARQADAGPARGRSAASNGVRSPVSAPSSGSNLDAQRASSIASSGPRRSAEPGEVAASAVRSGGEPLPAALRSDLEPTFGRELGDVRIHRDAPAQAAAHAIQARAYTVDNDIAFAAGAYQPANTDGRRLIAHELSHVLQQRESGTPTVQRQAEAPAATTLDPTYAGANQPASPPRSGIQEHENTSPYLKHPPKPDQIFGKGFEFLIDGDGDQSKELVVAFTATERDASYEPVRMKVEMKLLSGPAVVSQEYDLHDVMWTGALVPNVRTVTDGHEPTRFELFSEYGGHAFLLDPPKTDASGPTYQGRLGLVPGLDPKGRSGQSKAFHFAPDRAPVFSVFRPGLAHRVGDIWSLDASVGAYGDGFRFTFSTSMPPAPETLLGITYQPPDEHKGEVLMGISPLVGGSPSGGTRLDLKIAAALDVQVLSSTGAALVLDLDGDGKADISVYDRLTAEADYSRSIQIKDASQHRSHLLSVDGPAAAVSQPSAAARIQSGKLDTTIGGGERDFLAASQAAMVETLPQQAEIGTLGEQMASMQSQRQSARKRAADKGLIEADFYRIWNSLGEALVAIGLRLGAKLPATDLQIAAAFWADAFGPLFAREAALGGIGMPAGEFGSVDTNEYTGAYGFTGGTMDDFSQLLSQALRAGHVEIAMHTYADLASGLDRWIVRRLRDTEGEKSKDAARLESLVSLDTALHSISAHKPTRVDAVFHPDDATYARFGHIYDVPLLVFYWHTADEWHLKDVTNPDNTFEDTVDYVPGQVEPPQELFEKLDYKKHFVKGIIYFQIPGGRGGRVATTERMTWADYLAWASTAVAAAALIAVTAGAGTPVAVAGAWAFAASGVLGAASATMDLIESSAHGHLDAETVVLDVAQIVAGLAGASAMASGRITSAAAELALSGKPLAGGASLIASWADRLFVPLTATTAVADVVQFAVFTKEVAAQLDALDQGFMDPGDATSAKILLLGQLALAGGLTVLSLKGSLPEFTRGRSLEIVYVEGVPIARPVGRSYLGRDVLATRPEIGMEVDEAAFAAAKTQHLRAVRGRVGGALGAELMETEDLALRAAWRGEETRRVMDPVYGKQMDAARSKLPTMEKGRLTDIQKDMVGIFNDPTLDLATRRQQLSDTVKEIRSIARPHPELFDAIDFAAMERGIDGLQMHASADLMLADAAGNLSKGGKPAGTLHELMTRVSHVNNFNFENGVDYRYVIWQTPARTPGAPAEVHVLTRPVPKPLPGGPLPPKLPPLEAGAGGQYIVDLGVGESSYAHDLTPATDRENSLLVQSEPSDSPTRAQSSRGRGVELPGPHQDPHSVTVFGDALGNLEQFFGRPSEGRGVRRLFINNVNAYLDDAGYRKLADQLKRVMGKGSRLEIQWDTTPELTPKGQYKPRGHIQGDILNQAMGGRGYRYELAPGVPYTYTVTPTGEIGATTASKMGKLTPPNPAGKNGHRSIFTFE
ncbi:MAG: DUF4157 domain-containing protein [Caldimonas sp.]